MPRKKTILIVDDDRDASPYIGIILKRMGFNVSYAENAAEALELFSDSQPDIILINADTSMPSGTETLAEVRKVPDFFMTPVIMLSSSMEAGLVKRFADTGAHGVLAKPVRMDDLHEILQDFVYGFSGVRRKLMRVNARLKVMLMKDGEARRFTTESVSEGGMYLRTNSPYPVGTEVEMSIPAPDRDLRLRGRVMFHGNAYDSGTPVPPGMAVGFVRPDEDEALSLTRLVTKLMTGDLGKASEGTVQHVEKDDDTPGLRRGAA